tara:strand:- start:238 stop:492 length:255 start_codon:yes stop_codon:yes gene_type:complete
MKMTIKLQNLIENLEALSIEITEEIQDMIDTRNDTFDDRSEKWQESEKGDDFICLTDELEDVMVEAENDIDSIISNINDISELK